MDVSVLGIKQYKRIENSQKEGDLFAVCDILINSWLEIKNVRILRGSDNKMFVSFPQLKTESPKGSGRYRDVLSFRDPSVRKAIETKVLASYQDRLLNGLYMEDDFQISIKVNENTNERMRARASIELEGVKISGITIWEGVNGLRVSMPQRLMHNPVSQKDEWVDLIYPTNCYQKKLLMDKIIEAYQQERMQLVDTKDSLDGKLKGAEDGFERVEDSKNPFLQPERA